MNTHRLTMPFSSMLKQVSDDPEYKNKIKHKKLNSYKLLIYCILNTVGSSTYFDDHVMHYSYVLHSMAMQHCQSCN